MVKNQIFGHLVVCVYEMADIRNMRFMAGDISSLVLKVVRGQTPTIPSANVYSKPLIDLINAMLDKDAEKSTDC